MSSKRKGRRTLRKAKKYYELQGWIVDDCEKSGKFISNKDLFNLFDLVAIKGGVVKFIQVKTNNPAVQKPYRKWARAHGNSNIEIEVFTWYDYEGPRIQNYKNTGKIVEMDLRSSSNDGESLWKKEMGHKEQERLRQKS